MTFGLDSELEEGDLVDRLHKRDSILAKRLSELPQGLEEDHAYISDETNYLKYVSKDE